MRRVVRFGASPRAARALALGSKVRALSLGRANVAEEDLRSIAPAVLRHRILLNFEGEAEGLGPEDVVRTVLETVRS